MSKDIQLKRGAPAYVRFFVFEKLLDHLAVHGSTDVPIDPEKIEGLTSSVKQPLLPSLRYLGLITSANRPTSQLLRLAMTPKSERAEFYAILIMDCYPFIVEKYPSFKGINNKVLQREFEHLGFKGSTVQKGVSFFLELAKKANVSLDPLSFHELEHTNEEGSLSQAPRESDSVDSYVVRSDTKKVILKTGGFIKLTVDTDWMSLAVEDREFIFSLIDQLNEYGKGNWAKLKP